MKRGLFSHSKLLPVFSDRGRHMTPAAADKTYLDKARYLPDYGVDMHCVMVRVILCFHDSFCKQASNCDFTSSLIIFLLGVTRLITHVPRTPVGFLFLQKEHARPMACDVISYMRLIDWRNPSISGWSKDAYNCISGPCNIPLSENGSTP